MLLGITVRLEYVDPPGHVQDLKRYRARGYAMAGNRIAIVTDRSADLVEVHPPSRGEMNLGGLTVEPETLLHPIKQDGFPGRSGTICATIHHH